MEFEKIITLKIVDLKFFVLNLFSSIVIIQQVLSSLVSKLNKDIPSYLLDNIKSCKDALEYFQTEVKLTSSYDELASGKMVVNLFHMKKILLVHFIFIKFICLQKNKYRNIFKIIVI